MIGTRSAIAVIASLAVVSCAPTPLPPSPSATPTAAATAIAEATMAASPDWASLETALDLPDIAADAPCPRASGRVISAAFGPGLGDGPVYPIGLGADGVLGVVGAAAGVVKKGVWVGCAA
jgi:hypothetical protein